MSESTPKRREVSKQPPTTLKFPCRCEGESFRTYARRVTAFFRGDDIRTKADLRDWTGSLPFHLNRE